MKIFDLSQPLFDECPNCPAHPPARVLVLDDHPQAAWRMEKLEMAAHTGSHVDAPLHKIDGGAAIDDFALETFVGDAFLVDLRPLSPDAPIDDAILRAHLPADLRDKIVLICTGWGEKRAKTDGWLVHSPFLSPDGAQFLVENGARAVGIDHFSIGGTRDPDNTRTHEILLGAGLWIVEELRFPAEVFALSQPCKFWCLPINLRGASGAPCRPVIVANED